MTFDDLRYAIRFFRRRQPFRPFLVEFVSGDRVLVRHPELLLRDGTVFYVHDPETKYRLFNAASVCQVLDAL